MLTNSAFWKLLLVVIEVMMSKIGGNFERWLQWGPYISISIFSKTDQRKQELLIGNAYGF